MAASRKYRILTQEQDKKQNEKALQQVDDDMKNLELSWQSRIDDKDREIEEIIQTNTEVLKTQKEEITKKFRKKMEDLKSQKDQEMEVLKSQKDQEIEELTRRITKIQKKMEDFKSQRDEEKQKMQKVMTDNREHRRKLGTPESTAGVPGRPSSGGRNKSHDELTARPESKITTMTVQQLQALYNEYRNVPKYITNLTRDREPHLAWNRQLNNLKHINNMYKQQRTKRFLPNINPPQDTINAQDVLIIENIETKLAHMICLVEKKTATMDITGGDAQIVFWFEQHKRDDFMQKARKLDTSQVNISKLVDDVKNLLPFLRSMTINQFLETEDNDIKGKVRVLELFQEFEHLHEQSITDEFTVADRQRLEKLEKIMVHLLCWIEEKGQNKSTIEDTAQELELSVDEKKALVQWARQREQSHSKQVQQQEGLQIEDFDSPRLDAKIAVGQSNTQWIPGHPQYQGNHHDIDFAIKQDIEQGDDNSVGISDSRSATPPVIDAEADDAEADDATQANIANPYMLSPNVCIEA